MGVEYDSTYSSCVVGSHYRGRKRRAGIIVSHENKKNRTILKLWFLNVHGCHQHEKICETDHILRERDLDVMAVSQTKLKDGDEEIFRTFRQVKSEVRGCVKGRL